MGCDPRGAGWDRRARWRDRWVGPRQGGIERGGRTVDRGARVSATLSQCPHPVFGWQCCADHGDAEAKFALPLLESLGVARDRITLEDHSRNTVENAVYSKAIVQPKPGERWLLVTSAYHMPRAIGVFRKAGFPVEPYPVDWRTRGVEGALHPFATVSDGLRRTDTAVHE